MRYIPENSGAVLDTKTGLREWFNSYGEAIRAASSRNPEFKPMSRIEDLKALSASIDEELAAMNKVAARIALTGTATQCARFDAHGDRLVAERAKVREALKAYELSSATERVFPNDIANAESLARFEYAMRRQIEGMLRSCGK